MGGVPSTATEEKTDALGSDSMGFPLTEGMSLSYWLQGVRANPLLNHRSSETIPMNVDAVIIGSGMTGALVAHELLSSENPPKSVIMLEAREMCSGATGRNAGHCKPDQWRGFATYEKQFGTEQAMKILANEQLTWESLVAYINKENIDCDLWVGKTLDVAITDEVAQDAAEDYEKYKSAGGKVDHVEEITDPIKAFEISRIKNAKSVYSWNASTLYPWKVVAHIMKKNLDLGLNLQTWTPVTSVIKSLSPNHRDQWIVTTERGSIITPIVVHATNAYCSAILPEFKNLIKPTPHMCNKVVPPRLWSGTEALQNSYGVLCPGGALYSINPRCNTDGIVLFGGSNPGQGDLMDYVDNKDFPERRTDDGLFNFDPVTKAVRDFAEKELEGWTSSKMGPGQGYEYAWSGILGLSVDELPFVGAVPNKPGQWICAGHNGHGMARIFTCAPGLAKLIRGASWEETGLPECFEITDERFNKYKDVKFE